MSSHSPDSVQYALETTKVLYEPDRRIDTFGSTRFEFQLISELMDSVGQVRVRTGEFEASQPQIIRPEGYQEIATEGFGENAKKFFDWMEQEGQMPKILQYGFHFKRSDVRSDLVHEPLESVRGRLLDSAREEGRPMLAVLEGVDDAWEICLLRFAMEMITKSQGINLFDFKRKGLL
ncbi:hypothetical protein [Roseibacillus ishigakijimensis]|uniref:Uncharacterized protein n=1 Tax=Roseibacillus ishigakijimensis TaxID=454146 RepID=A0A934RQG6_9BACT|nr:hypothetical protein [Roseibacillus ishigakijimensis]MBK1833997.1 hypothetical protein [Roseibacillus ishigakijimensis]